MQTLDKNFSHISLRHGENSHLTGLIYIHRISDLRLGGTWLRNLRIFCKLCGTDSLKNVVILTTMWDKVTPEEGLKREQALVSSSNLFKPLLDEGAIMMRHERMAESANKVISYLLGKNAITTQIVRELVQEHKTLEETAAGGELYSDIQVRLRRCREEIELLDVEMKSMLAEGRPRTDHKLAKLMAELNKLKRCVSSMNVD